MSVCQRNLVCRCELCLKGQATTSERVLGWFVREIENTFQMCHVFRNAFAGTGPLGIYGLEALPINFQCPCCGFTLLHLAVSVGSRPHVQYYLQRSINVDAKNDNGDTALHMAIVSANWRIIDDLLCHGADLNILDAIGCTPLEICLDSQTKCPAAIEALLQHGDRLNNLFSVGTIEEVLKANRRTPNGTTPLCDAVQRNDPETARSLLQVGACSDLRLANQTALMMACSQGFEECVLVLLEAGADFSQEDSDRRTALHHAVLGGKSSIVTSLLNVGCDLQLQDLYGCTALDLAVLGNRVHIVELLLDHGAGFGDAGDLAFQAIEKGASDALATLIQRDIVDVNETNEFGDSLLTVAVTAGLHSFVHFLLSNGAEDDFDTPTGDDTQSLATDVRSSAT